MRKKSKSVTKRGIIFSFLKNNVLRLRYLLLLIIIVAYSWYWSSLPKVVKNESLAIQKVIELPEQNMEISEAEIGVSNFDFYPLEMAIQQRVSLVPEIDELPEIEHVLHTVRLRKLRKKITYEEKLPRDIIEHKQKDVVFTDAKIAVVIDDMGGSLKRTREIIELKAPLTSSFLTFAPKLKEQVKRSREAGHEIMIHVPMQPSSNIYVSEDVLKVNMDAKQITENFSKMLDKFDNVKGINNHMGSKFTEHADKLAPVMKLLAERNLFFLDSKTTPKSKAEKVAKDYGVSYVHRNVFLDNNNDFNYIMKQLELTERIAKKNGYAIAIGHPKSQTSKALKVWLTSLKSKGIKLVPLSELVAN